MSLTAQGKMVVSRNRCDSPAPRAAGDVAADVKEARTSPAMAASKDSQSSAPPLSIVTVLAIALLLGRAALISETKELLGDTPTWIALAIFVAIGAAVMRFDFMEFAKDEAKKEVVHIEPASTGWIWLTLALLLGAILAWNGMTMGVTTPPYSQSIAAVGPAATHKLWDPVMIQELYSRSSKLKGAPEDLENTHGRDFDASLVQEVDVSTGAVRRSARKEVAAIAEAAQEKCVTATASLRWRIFTTIADEVTIFFLTAAIAIGLATTISDYREISRSEQEVASESGTDSPSAEKLLKPSSSRSQWRLMACIALFLAVVVAFVASIAEDM